MPELAEVVYFAKQWEVGLNEVIEAVLLRAEKRIFRETDLGQLEGLLVGARFQQRLTSGKLMAFTGDFGWLGLHLGMTGQLATAPLPYQPGPHDHFVLLTGHRALIFTDPRLFGRVLFSAGATPPEWWSSRPSPPQEAAFTLEVFLSILEKRARTPLKALLLDQRYFNGLGNWMADEILWRSQLRPDRRSGEISSGEARVLFTRLKEVCTDALCVIAGEGGAPLPHGMNAAIPDTWLFNHRWRDGGICPATGTPLSRAVVGGRTTCWSPAWQH